MHLNKPTNAEDLTGLIASMLGAPALRSDGANGHEPPLLAHAKPSAVRQAKRRSDAGDRLRGRRRSRPALDHARVAQTGRPRGRDLFQLRSASSKPTCPSRKGCLIVDAQMQGMGGLALLEWLKSEGSESARHHDHRVWRRVDGRQSHESRRRGFHREADQADELLASIESALDRTQDSGKRSAWHATAAKCIADLTPQGT